MREIEPDDDSYPFSDLPTPDPEYDPKTVMDIQLEALAANDDPIPDAGIKTAYNFASPENRRHTGPYERFARMVRGRRYAPMVDHVEAVTGPPERSGATVTRRVTLTGPTGRTATYEFQLSKAATGPFRTCWQTDAVRLD